MYRRQRDKTIAARPGPSDSDRVVTEAAPVYTVGVRELVEFALRRGDLGGTRDFAGADRALAGIRGHQRLQRLRPAGYRKEVWVTRDVAGDGFILRVQGRIDGVLVADGAVLLEEIKTVRGGWDRVAQPLHWAQIRLYAFLYAHDLSLDTLNLQLVYLDLVTGELTEFQETAALPDLAHLFQLTVTTYLQWIQDRHQWRQLRNQSIQSLQFPFPHYRPGQRPIAVAAYRTLARGGRLFVEAPTGIGKTMAVLFPALKALAEGQLERIFYLTARTVGRTVAEQALRELRQAGLRLRSITLTARDKLCVQDGHPCDPGNCPLARGYYDRRHAAMRAALRCESLSRFEFETISRQHQVCPFELSLDVSLWVDLILGDYNHRFDPRACLRRHFNDDPQPHALLVDEAHNLVDRAREMFSADLTALELRNVARQIRTALPRCARALSRINTSLRELIRITSPQSSPLPVSDPSHPQPELFGREPSARHSELNPQSTGRLTLSRAPNRLSHTHRELPQPLIRPIDTALEEAEGWLILNQAADFRQSLLELYFRLLAFRRTAELYDESFVTFLETDAALRVRLYCLDPSRLLRQALDAARGTVFFSATLTPVDYYRRLLGGDASDPWLQLGSPFPKEQLAVLVHDKIRTELVARSRSLADVVQAIGTLVQGRRGNYLAYFPSYRYLTAVREAFAVQYPAVLIRTQQPGMSEAQREAFLTGFDSAPETTQVGFAVLGGIFGEGIDLVGNRLIGVVVVGVGLPQLCTERDLISDHFQAETGRGFDYAYTFPGMNRVLQAVGRVIRSSSDRGAVLLVDSRFAQARYRRLFPAWWHPLRVGNTAGIRSALTRFWSQHG